LDVLLERHPFSEDSFVIFQLANLERFTGYVSASAVTPEQFMRIIADTEQ
jgi:hypothetical protein